MINEKILIDLARERDYETLDKYIRSANYETKVEVVKELFDQDITSFLIGEKYYKEFGINEKLPVSENAVSELIIAGKYDEIDWVFENLEYNMEGAMVKALDYIIDDYKRFKKYSFVNSVVKVLGGSCLALSIAGLFDNFIFGVKPLELVYGFIGTISGVTALSLKDNSLREKYVNKIKELKERYNDYFEKAVEKLDKEKVKYLHKILK